MTAPTPLVLILLGPPGAGKGTQAKMIEEKWQLPHISTGDLLRAHIRKATNLGKQAKQFMDQGNLVPDALILDMLFERVSQEDCVKGYILDGFPRTIHQAETLQKRLEGKASPLVINLDLSDEEIILRLTKRVICEKCGIPYHLLYSPPRQNNICDNCGSPLIQRPDDTEEVIRKRLKIYHEQTAPLIAFYSKQKLLHTISCCLNKEAIFQQVASLIDSSQ